MFKEIVGIEPLGLIDSANLKLESFADNLVLHTDMPTTDDEIVKRIGAADAVLLSYTTTLTKEILERCPNVKYIGMCCSLYTPESANVDINYANSKGITVTGVRDYGDEGVVEYVISELVRCLHGFGNTSDGKPRKAWSGIPREITGLKVGVIGLGKLGGMVADGLNFLGADITYFARSEKQEAKEKGYHFLPLDKLMETNEVVIAALNKNTVLLHEEEFLKFGNSKILFNIGLSPAWDSVPFNKWINTDNNVVYCDSLGALGGKELLKLPNVNCFEVSSGRTQQAFVRLSEKVIENINTYFKG
ncbi:NAD(P)-dependent oxidoreductase [Polaribacter sargassicola]|uniref:NAD(P)-dependent oxidoreductase n=1 Tax=Polaribacter sargassicola TaxID=2836891 RepID=UPI001F3E7D9C|nr:NAD(P)-dependent oxidoreductase [Polaribacter sp. DS7-9]MCG1034972.1 dihydrofolate reductase [Polaribacter sp. DS7-9]